MTPQSRDAGFEALHHSVESRSTRGPPQMKKPTLARIAAPRWSLLVVSTLLLAACGGDLTSPPVATLVPTDANKALVGAVSGVYTFTVNPNASAVLSFGQSHLDLPA